VKPTQITRLAVLAAVVVAAVLAGYAVDRATAQRARLACNADLRGLKTLSDPQRKLVRLVPKGTTVEAINGLPMPRPTPARRTTAFSRQVWRIRAQITEYRIRGDGDVHLVLYDGGRSYMIAKMPSAACLSAKTRARGSIVRARAFFEGLCGPARSSWRPLGAVVRIDGVGFWSVPTEQYGHARNHAELHPVTRIQLIEGCA
jgi:hypothetical protein